MAELVFLEKPIKDEEELMNKDLNRVQGLWLIQLNRRRPTETLHSATAVSRLILQFIDSPGLGEIAGRLKALSRDRIP